MERYRPAKPFPLPRYQMKPRKSVDIQWNGVFENWSRDYVRKNFWKVRNVLLSREDAIGECAVIFARCLRKYENTVDNAAWFMALYKTAVWREFVTFANKDTASRAYTAQTRVDDSAHDYNHGPLIVALSERASVRRILELISNASPAMLDFVLQDTFDHRLDDVKSNRRLSRLAGIAVKDDAITELRHILTKGK